MTVSFPRFLAFVLVLAFFLGGCHAGRYTVSSPGTNQVLRATSGDRFFMDLEENATAGYQWYGTCSDPDVSVVIDHKPGKDGDGRVGTPGTAEVTIRVHRGFDGPSAVTFAYRRSWEKEPVKKFTITLYKRTGDCAFWE